MTPGHWRRVLSAGMWLAAMLGLGLSLAVAIAGDIAGHIEGNTGRRTPTARDAIETARFMTDRVSASEYNPDGVVSISPNGRRYVVRIVRGDAQRNGVWMQLITGDLDSLEQASNGRTVAQLFSSGRGARNGRRGADQDTSPVLSRLRWLDDVRVAFLWSDEREIPQVTRVDLTTGKVDRLTQHPSAVISFDIGAEGEVLYQALLPLPSNLTQTLREGFAVEPDTDAVALLLGFVNAGPGADYYWNAQWFLKRTEDVQPRHIRFGRDAALNSPQRAWSSPAGGRAIVSTNAAEMAERWNVYDDEYMAHAIRTARLNPNDPIGRQVHQLFLLDTDSAQVRPLWGAAAMSFGTEVSWSPEGGRLLLAPTFLPPQDHDPRGRSGTAAVVVEADTGRYSVLPTELGDSRVAALRWLAADRVELTVVTSGQAEHRHFKNVRGRWQAVEEPNQGAASPHVRFELRQSLDTPPRLYAVDAGSGEARLVVDPNPDLLARFELGSVERIEGDTAAGERWAGLLFHPPGYRAERRYPLVIQSVYGSAPSEEFTLYGYQQDAGLGPTLIASYPGRLLAARDILVLHMDVTKGRKFGTPAEPEVRQRAFEAAAQQLVQAGLVDRQRVGLLGFSRNGYYVEHTLTHSAFPFAAAISADNWDPSYMATTLAGFNESAVDIHGARPFGAGLGKWIERAPGFNAEQVRTPLLTIVQSTGMLDVLLKWELFARLRYLGKAVELYVMPDAMYGAHCTQNPKQILAVQQRSIDWFDFWLNGREDVDQSKAHQYERWRVLRELAKKADIKRSLSGSQPASNCVTGDRGTGITNTPLPLTMNTNSCPGSQRCSPAAGRRSHAAWLLGRYDMDSWPGDFVSLPIHWRAQSSVSR